jgi:hypothetical protein
VLFFAAIRPRDSTVRSGGQLPAKRPLATPSPAEVRPMQCAARHGGPRRADAQINVMGGPGTSKLQPMFRWRDVCKVGAGSETAVASRDVRKRKRVPGDGWKGRGQCTWMRSGCS